MAWSSPSYQPNLPLVRDTAHSNVYLLLIMHELTCKQHSACHRATHSVQA
jgi:hypothetical protein